MGASLWQRKVTLFWWANPRYNQMTETAVQDNPHLVLFCLIGCWGIVLCVVPPNLLLLLEAACSNRKVGVQGRKKLPN